MNAQRVASLSLLCQEATGRYPPEIVFNGQFCLDNIQMEVDEMGECTGRFRKFERGIVTHRPAGTTSPAGKWPSHWSDVAHEFDGHGIGVDPADRLGEEMLARELNALYVQHGVAVAVDDVSGAYLDPDAVREGREIEMGFFKTMGVYDYVPRSEQATTGGKIIATKWIDVNTGDLSNPGIRCRLVGKEFRTGPDDAL